VRTAEQQVPISATHQLRVLYSSEEEEFLISEDGNADDFEPTAAQAAQNVWKRIFRLSLAAMPDHVQLRAALLRRSSKGILIAGPSKSGKTTLGLRLMFEGYDLDGDELALLRGTEAVAFPQRFSVPESSIALVPQVRSLHIQPQTGADPAYAWRFLTDPSDFGRRWQIAPAPIDAVFVLEPNFGARTEATPAGKLDTVRRLLPLASPPSSMRRDWIGDVSRLVDSAKTFTLRLGDLDTALVAVDRALW
jgi:hypothetical protein